MAAISTAWQGQLQQILGGHFLSECGAVILLEAFGVYPGQRAMAPKKGQGASKDKQQAKNFPKMPVHTLPFSHEAMERQVILDCLLALEQAKGVPLE